jgi:hypothetical protein
MLQTSPLSLQSSLTNSLQTSLLNTTQTSNTQSNSAVSDSSLMMMLVFSLLQSFLGQLMGNTTATDASGTSTSSTDTGTTGTTEDSTTTSPYTTTDPYDDTSTDSGYTDPGTADCPPPPPPVYQNQVLGSAGLFGDPKFGVFTPNLGTVPAALQGFESNIAPGQTVTLLQDSDQGGLSVSGTGTQVDPNNPQSTGIGSATFRSGNDTVTIGGDGSLVVNGQNQGNINDDGLIAPIQLPSGLAVSTNPEIDDANGDKTERFVISNGEYKITAAARKPHPDANGYLDMNFEELTPDAADNATGYQTGVPGLNQSFGIADLLRLEPGSLELTA